MSLLANQKAYLKHLAAAGDMMAKQLIATDTLATESGRAGFVSLGAVAAKGIATVHSIIAGTSSVVPVTTGITNPSQPRNVSASFGAAWDGGNVVVTGTDQWDHDVTETIVAVQNTTVAGVKIFKTVTSVAHTAVGTQADGYSVGTGDKLGMTVDLTDTMGIGAVQATAGAANTPEAITVDPTVDGVTFTTVPNGTKVLVALVNF